mmetsp:Transcript_8662/g.13707  ORF Transcript_8662/g.13707 Transcript_8662/m.13707 type:complete len:81 (-) Transcript_8662:150-392(-)
MHSLAWVSVEHPVVYTTETVNSLPVFGEKVLKLAAEAEEGAELHQAFVDSFKDLQRGLLIYVKEYHSKGLSWNPQGKELK